MKCCICGTIKNVETYLKKIFENMELIGTLFVDYVIILYYDDSSDNTLKTVLQHQSKNEKIKLIVNTEPPLPYRTHRIAKGRNKCLDMIKSLYSDFDFFIVMDCDDKCCYNLKLNLLDYYITFDSSRWDALSFNHPEGYYDTWALSKRPHVISYAHFANVRGQKGGYNLITKLIKNSKSNELIPCLSAFNGISIYKTELFIDCRYDGTYRLDYIPKNLIDENLEVSGKLHVFENNKEDCEHRHFHFEAVLKNKARIMISPHCLFFKI
jgi:hypothetical protein